MGSFACAVVAAGVVAAVDAAFAPGAPERFAAAAASAVVAGVLPAFPAVLGAVLVADVTVPASAAAGPAIVGLAAPRPGIRCPGIRVSGIRPSSSSSFSYGARGSRLPFSIFAVPIPNKRTVTVKLLQFRPWRQRSRWRRERLFLFSAKQHVDQYGIYYGG